LGPGTGLNIQKGGSAVKEISRKSVTHQSRVAGTSFVAAWGYGRVVKEASAGTGCDLDREFYLRKERREALAPAPATEKSAP